MGRCRLSPTVPFQCPDRSPGRLRQKRVPSALPRTGKALRCSTDPRAEHTAGARSPYHIVRGKASASRPFRIYHQSPGLPGRKSAQPVPSSTGSHKRSQTRPRSKYVQPVPSHTGKRRTSQTSRLTCRCYAIDACC